MSKLNGRSRGLLVGAVVLVVVGFVALAGFSRMYRGGWMAGPMNGGMMRQEFRSGMMREGFRGGMMVGHRGMMGSRGGHFGGWVLLLAGLGAGGYLLAKRLPMPAGAEAAPLDVLRLRLAQGQISAEEFDRLKNKVQE